MKKTLTLTILILIGLSFLPAFMPAQGDDDIKIAPDINIIGEGGVLDIIFQNLFKILMITAAIFFVIAGYYFVTAQGDPEKFSTAKRMIIYGIIGLVVAFSSIAIVEFVERIYREPPAPFEPTD